MRTLSGRDRARVPFALVGVVLLVSSTAFHASLGAAPAVREPDTEAALERAGAALVPALRVAVRRAARDAATDPVVTPANTTVGRALNDSRPYRDAFRLRAYLAARASLGTVRTREGPVEVTASLPPVRENTSAVRHALERVEIETMGPNDARLRVTVRNVTLRAVHGGRVQDGRVRVRQRLDPSVTVTSPVLAVHERTVEYRRRLDASAVAPDSAGARLTLGAQLAASARGTAQWAGAPLANVLGNRHVALATDAAVYDAQARTFGARDPTWRSGLTETAARVAGRDAFELGFEGGKLTRTPTGARAMAVLRRFLSGARVSSGPPLESDRVAVGVNRSADAALAALLRRPARDSRNLSRVLRRAYTVDARLATQTRRLGSTRSGQRRPSTRRGWDLVERRETVDSQVRTLEDPSTAQPVDAVGEWHRLAAGQRLVTVQATVVRRWRAGGRTAVTRRRTTRRYAVTVAVLGRHAPPENVPRRPVRPVHRSGGTLDGPSFSGVAERATDRLVTDRGGFDALAERSVTGGVNTSAVPVVGRRPAGLEDWVRGDLLALHRRVRNVSVERSRRRLGTLDAAPAASLAAVLRQRRQSLLDVPRTYDGVADRARIAARAAYLQRVLDDLEGRAARRERARARLNDSLVSRGLPSLPRVERLRAVAANVTSSDRRGDGRGGVRFVPDATPNRLALTSVSRDAVGLRGGGTVRPLAARNLNVFTLPAGDVASLVRDDGPGTVPLPTAARILRAARNGSIAHVRARPGNGSLPRARWKNGSLVAVRGHLRDAVVAQNGALRARIRERLRREGIEGATRRRELVAAGLDPWETPAGRALAFTNGSAAESIAAVTAARASGSGIDGRTDRLALLLEDELDRALRGPAGRVPRRPTQRTGRLVRDLRNGAVTEVTNVVASRVNRSIQRRLYRGVQGSVPAGLPVLPPVQPWYATVNVWHVEVRGAHPSFVVRTRGRGGPGPPLTYERDGRPVRLDVDRDGDAERLGTATRVAFHVETAVLVVVPPGGRGVGDVDGNADERTGWPRPEPWPATRRSEKRTTGADPR